MIVLRGKPVHKYPEDMNNNVESKTGSYSGQLSVPKESFVVTSPDRCVPEVIGSESSDWSDIDVTLDASCFYIPTR